MKKAPSDLRFGLALLIPIIIFVLVLNTYPMIYSIWISLHRYDLTRPGGKPFIGLENFSRAFGDELLPNSLLVTLRFTIEATLISLFLGLGVALVLNERFRGRSIMRMLVLLPWSFSTYAVATIYRYLLSEQFGFFNSVMLQLGLIRNYLNFLSPDHAIDWLALAFSWNFAPLGAFFLLSGLQVIPEDLYKQAKIDGAGPIRRFLIVTLPYLRHSLLITLILTSIFAATETTLIIGLTGGGPGVSTQTLTYWIFAQTFQNYDFGYGAAISWLLIALVLALGVSYFTALTRIRKVIRY
jgi:multiple sugar transport system permease protein